MIYRICDGIIGGKIKSWLSPEKDIYDYRRESYEKLTRHVTIFKLDKYLYHNNNMALLEVLRRHREDFFEHGKIQAIQTLIGLLLLPIPFLENSFLNIIISSHFKDGAFLLYLLFVIFMYKCACGGSEYVYVYIGDMAKEMNQDDLDKIYPRNLTQVSEREAEGG